MLVEFMHSDSNSPVWVNTEHVVKVFAHAEDPDVTVLRLADGEQFGVRGKAREVVESLDKS